VSVEQRHNKKNLVTHNGILGDGSTW